MKLPLWVKWLGVNLFVVLCHPSLGGLMDTMPPAARSLAVNAMLFLLPAVGWSGLVSRATRPLGMRLAFHVAVSTLVFLVSLVAFRLLGVALTAERVWNALWLVTNLGFACAALAGRVPGRRRSLLPREMALGGVLFFSAYALYYFGATRVVPPQVDHDLEVQATGYGLLTRLEPLLFTDRGGVYYFAHPPLLHALVGGSFLLHGSFQELKFYDEASLRARDVLAGRPIAPLSGTLRLKGRGEVYRIAGTEGSEYLLVPEKGGEEERIPMEEGELARIYMRYGERPYPLETRTPNLFFASAAVALLGLFVGRISRRWWMGLLVAAAYATSPEILVRSSYGGYFAIGSFACILLLIAAEQWWRRPAWKYAGIAAVMGAFAALADHKLVLLPAAIGIHAALRGGARGWQRVRALLRHPAVVGFAGGTLCFWAYGLLIAPAEFVQDHFFHHLVDRITHTNPLGYKGYATPLGLWVELARHSAYVLLPAGVGLLLYDVSARRKGLPAREILSKELWLLWIILTAAVFTLTDWRMTKHVVLLLLPLHLALAPDRDAPRWRIAVPVAVLLVALTYNIWALGKLVRDFAGFPVTPAW